MRIKQTNERKKRGIETFFLFLCFLPSALVLFYSSAIIYYTCLTSTGRIMMMRTLATRFAMAAQLVVYVLRG